MKIKSPVTLAAFAVAILSSVIPFRLNAQNPIVQTNYTADPAPMVHNGTVYLYTTHDEDKTVRNFFTMGIWTVVFTFTFVELFDTFGTLVGTANKAGLIDKDGKSPKIGKAMLVDAIGVSFGALMGTSTITTYVESAAGIGEGGRTGLTAITTGFLFLLALFIAPLAQLIPDAATAPALIIVGVLMASSIVEIDFKDFTEGFPAFMTFTLMPFTYSIANGIAGGIVFYTLLKVVTGQGKKVHWMMYLLFALVVTRYIFLSE